MAEALEMREKALARGIPDEAILVEPGSNHTKENVLASLLVLDRIIGLHRLHRLLVVGAPHHARRCLLTLCTYMPRWVEFTWCPDDRPHPRADNWWERSEDERLIRKEARSLVTYVRERQLLDQELHL